jgi:hypothetical protein
MLKRVIQRSVLGVSDDLPDGFAADFLTVAAADDNFPGTAIVATGFIPQHFPLLKGRRSGACADERAYVSSPAELGPTK